MLVSFILKIVVERNNIVHEIQLEFLNIFSLPFAIQKLLPCFEKILDGNDIIVGMIEPLKSPPNRVCPVFWKRLRVLTSSGMMFT